MNQVKPNDVNKNSNSSVTASNVFDLIEDHDIIEEEIETSYLNDMTLDRYISVQQPSMASSSFISPYDEMDTDDILNSLGNNQCTNDQSQGINNLENIYGIDNSTSISSRYESDTDNTPPSTMDNESENTLELESQLGIVNDIENTDKTNTTYSKLTYVDLLSSDDEDKYGEKTGQSETSQLIEPKPVPVDENAIIFLLGSKDCIFPRYDISIISRLKQFLHNKTEKDKVYSDTNGSRFLIGDLMRVLMPRAWLNDIIVQNYISLTMRYCKPNILDLNTHFVSNLKLRGYESASRWLKRGSKKSAFCYKKILVPLNPGSNHWSFFVVNLKAGIIIIYNSFGTIHMDEMELIVDFFAWEYDIVFMDKETDIMYPKNWNIRNGRSPLQNNDYDCGVFTCTNVRYALLDRKFDYSQEDIPFLRQRITFELINNTLLPF